jgi:selenocysteine lyase/cysteine desulfurase
MTYTADQLFGDPNALAPHYSRFRVSERILLTGHSHQAWPDAAFDGQMAAIEAAAELVDDKWEHAFATAGKVKAGYRHLLDDPDGRYSLASSTHDLLVKLLSALPWHRRRKIVTTDREFYSLDRQLRRLEEEGIEVVRVAAHPASSVGDRLTPQIDDTTAAVFTSTVFFSSAHIAGDLTTTAEACRRHGVPLVLDVYHQLNVVPFSLRERDLEDAFVVGAGYKYCQLGEGNAFLRCPASCDLRPLATGWFAEFSELTAERGDENVAFPSGDDRFAGGTYDPASHYRAAAVFEFFSRHRLSVDFLREISQHQVRLLAERFDALDLPASLITRDHSVDISRLGGFLALRSAHAGRLWRRLKAKGVATDQRGDILRLGPAPYLSDLQLETAIAALGAAASEL